MKTARKSFSNSLTAGKQYPVVRESNGNTIIIDDEGFEVGYSDSYFETSKEIINPQLEGFFIPDDWQKLSA